MRSYKTKLCSGLNNNRTDLKIGIVVVKVFCFLFELGQSEDSENRPEVLVNVLMF